MRKKITAIKLAWTLKTAGLLGSLVALAISLLTITGAFDEIELKVLNAAFQKRTPIEKRPDIITIDIDDSAVGAIDRWPWSWDKHAMLLDFLALYRAHTVAFIDIDFSKEIPFSFPVKTVESYKGMLHSMSAYQRSPELILSVLPDFNKDFYGSLRRNGDACFTVGFKIPETADNEKSLLQAAETAAGIHPEQKKEGIRLLNEKIGLPGRSDAFRISTDALPLAPEILKYSECAGFNAVMRERDGVVHKYPLMTYYRGSLYPSIGLQLARKFLDAGEVKVRDGEYIELRGKSGQVRIPVDRKGEMHINWAGDYTDSFVHLPFELVALLIGHQMAKDELSGHSAEELMKDPMALNASLIQRLAGSRLFSENQGIDISSKIIIAALFEHSFARNPGRTAEEIISALGIGDPKDEALLAIGRQTYFNNYLLSRYKASGKIPAYEEAMRESGLAINKEMEPRFRDSHAMMAYCMENNLVGKVRPLYFYPTSIAMPGSKELSITPLFFRDKIVFYGLTATGLAVQTASPFNRLHDILDMVPNVVNTILTGQFIRELHPALEYLMICAYALGVAFCVLLLSPLPGFAFVGVIAGGHLGVAWLSFSAKGYIVPVAPLLSALAASYLLAVVYRYFQEQRERRKVRDMFSTMVSPEVLRMVEENPDIISY